MDTSETYVKMCDCEEVQSEWEPIRGDVDEHGIVAMEHEGWLYHVNGMYVGSGYLQGDAVWLPRQDQIQEMMRYASMMVNTYATLGIFEEITEFAKNIWESQEDYQSAEQLWLAFYMREKHNKVWSGSEWVASA